MTGLVILCVEDEPEVRDALVRDLEPFAEISRIETADRVNDAREALSEATSAGGRLALALCSHPLPGMRGVEFLIELNADPSTATARKVLVTGEASPEDTVRAVNEADLDHCIAKPWSRGDLVETVKRLLTDFVIDEVDDLTPFLHTLDDARLLVALRERESAH